eukprot:403336713
MLTHKSQVAINALQQYAQSSHNLNGSPSQANQENQNLLSNVYAGVLGHRNSNASIAQSQNSQHLQTLNTSTNNRKQKQSPNIVKGRKLFPEDFFSGQQNLGVPGSPNSHNTLQYSSLNGSKNRGSAGHTQNQEENDDVDENSQNSKNEISTVIQKLPLAKSNTQKPENIPSNSTKSQKRFMFPENDTFEQSHCNVKLQSKFKKSSRDKNMISNEIEVQPLEHQKFMSPKNKKQLKELSQNLESSGQVSQMKSQQQNEPFDGLKTQYVQLSLDSDKLSKLQGNKGKLKQNLPFNKINSESRYKGRNNEGASQSSSYGITKVDSRELARDNEYVSQQMNSIERQMRQSQSDKLNSSKGNMLPDLKGSKNKNFNIDIGLEQEYQIGQIPIISDPNMLNYSSQRLGAQQRVPIFMRNSLRREDLDSNQDNLMMQINQDSSQTLHRNHPVNRTDFDPSFLNAGSPQQSSRIHDFSSSNINSNGKYSQNSSTLLQPNQNHYHQWNSRSPQILKDLDTHQHITNQPLYFPQSTRNLQISRSPTNALSSIGASNGPDTQVKFPNIFNHNINYESQKYQDKTNTQNLKNSSGLHTTSKKIQLNFPKNGKIQLDHNYQVIQNVKKSQMNVNGLHARNNVIQERKETSESERSYKGSVLESEKQQFKQIKKPKQDRKMLTSRDQEERWIEQPQRLSLGRIQSKSKLENSNESESLLQHTQKSNTQKRKKSPFSQSGMCWYSQPTNQETNGISTFGPIKKRKEDQPRYSLPENKSQKIHQEEVETRVKSRQGVSRSLNQNNGKNSTRMTYDELETPHFKQQNNLVHKGSIAYNQRNVRELEDIACDHYSNKNQKQNNTQSNQNNQYLSKNNEYMHFEFNENCHEIFDDENFTQSSQRHNDEYSRSPMSQDINYMRYDELQQSSPANYDKLDQTILKSQNQQVQVVSQKGNVEVRGRLSSEQNDQEVKKFKVINKAKKIEKQHLTAENKAKLIKQLEKNLKKVKNPVGGLNELSEQQEQITTSQQLIAQSNSNSCLKIKEGNSSNTTSNNNSQLQKKIPLIKRSQITNQPNSTEHLQKVKIIKNTSKVHNTNYHGKDSVILEKQANQSLFDNYDQNYNSSNQQNQQVNFSSNSQQFNNNYNQIIDNYQQTSHFLENCQQVIPHHSKAKRQPLSSIDNHSSFARQTQNFELLNSFKSGQFLEQTPSFNSKQLPMSHHQINQIYMAAQIPQEFNGMITFMNIQQQVSSDNASHSQDTNSEIDAFKQTGGSLMRGTILSLTSTQNFQNPHGGNNAVIMNSTIQGSNPQGSCNNSIIMMRSEGNYMTSNFGGGNLQNLNNNGNHQNSMNAQHLIIMQQQITNNINQQGNKQTNQKQSQENQKLKGQEKSSKYSSAKRNKSNGANKENLYFMDKQKREQEGSKLPEQNQREPLQNQKQEYYQQQPTNDNFKLEFQNSKIKKPVQQIESKVFQQKESVGSKRTQNYDQKQDDSHQNTAVRKPKRLVQ